MREGDATMADTYQITSQTPTTEIDPTGRGFQEVWEIAYKVTNGAARGTVGRITVTNADHTAEYVDRAIRSKISDLHDIASLGGTE